MVGVIALTIIISISGNARLSALPLSVLPANDTIWFPLPAFLQRQGIGVFDTAHAGDTLYYFSFFDSRDSLIEHPFDPDEFGFISLIKSYHDFANLYTDHSGKKLPLPVSIIVLRYDRVDDTTWQVVNYAHNSFSKITTDYSKRSGADSFDYQVQYEVPYKKDVIGYYFCPVNEEKH